MDIKHLDTLVGPRTEIHQRLYDMISKAAVTLEMRETLVDGEFIINRSNGISREFYSISSIDKMNYYYRDNVSSHLVVPGEEDVLRLSSIDGICKNVLYDQSISYFTEPWEVL